VLVSSAMATPRSARPASAAAASSRLRLRTPAHTTSWRQRWFRRRGAGIPSHASDAVVAARLGRTVTIATALITALVGITATVSAAYFTYKTSSQRLAAETEKSATEFLRQQRQAAYTAFAAEAQATADALAETMNLFPPIKSAPPTEEDFNGVYRDLSSHFGKLTAAQLNLELVASEDVCDAATSEQHALVHALQTHIEYAEWWYNIKHQPPPDYRKVRLTDEEIHTLPNTFIFFTRAAREDLSDPTLRKPAKNCPKPR
jgi:hypothetical protein